MGLAGELYAYSNNHRFTPSDLLDRAVVRMNSNISNQERDLLIGRIMQSLLVNNYINGNFEQKYYDQILANKALTSEMKEMVDKTKQAVDKSFKIEKEFKDFKIEIELKRLEHRNKQNALAENVATGAWVGSASLLSPFFGIAYCAWKISEKVFISEEAKAIPDDWHIRYWIKEGYTLEEAIEKEKELRDSMPPSDNYESTYEAWD